MPRPLHARLLAALTVLLSAVLVTGQLTTGAQAATTTTMSPTAPRLLWGAFARPRGSENLRSALEHLETRAGRTVGATRVYLKWDSGIGSYEHWLVDTGRTPLISITSTRHGGTTIPWHSIASAGPTTTLGKEINAWADRIKSLKGPVYFTFNHEPEAAESRNRGTNADFIAAWRHIVTMFRNRGVTNAKYLWTMTGWSFGVNTGDRRSAAKWYPGDAYVDALGSDEYNVFNCRTDFKAPWRPLATQVEAFRRFGLTHPGKELWLPEFGSVEDRATPNRKAAWMNEIKTAFKDPKYSQFRGLVYFHAIREGTPCAWWVDSSSSAISAWGSMGRDSFFTRRY